MIEKKSKMFYDEIMVNILLLVTYNFMIKLYVLKKIRLNKFKTIMY